MPNRYFVFTNFVLCVAALLATNFLHAQTQIVLPAIKDNTLFESTTGSNSNGTGQNFFAGNNRLGNTRRGLVVFSVVEIPMGATIESVTLTLNMSKTQAGAQDIKLHRVLADWGEGTSSGSGQGTASTTGDATWIHRFFNTDLWASPGGDFSATVSASQSVSGIGAYTWGSTSQMVADVQHWLDNSSENFGWILIGNEGSNQTVKRFDTRENTTVANRPKLTVTFSQPTSVAEDNSGLPEEFSLAQNYPNPFNPSTNISYTIPQAANFTTVRLDIYNVLGQFVRTLINEAQSAGLHRVQWDGRNEAGELVSSGVYIYALKAGKFADTRKMIFVR